MENHSDSERTEIWSDDWDSPPPSPPAPAVEGTRKERGSTSCKLQCAQTMEDHLDTESTEILGDWDSPPPATVEGTRKETGGSTSCAARVGGRVLPPWAHPSYEWGGGKWKVDGRKIRKKKGKETAKEKEKEKEKDKDKDTDKDKEKEKEKEKESLRSLEDLMNEYSSLPPQIAEWYWCIEYVAKFHKDLPCILDLMNMGYPSTNDYGSRINEILSLRILEFLFDPTKNIDSTATVGPRIEFDFSLTNTHVLHAILKHMNMPELPNLFSICTVVSELRPGMQELSNFNLLPFIAHKNMSLPLCALEKLRDVIAMENNRTSAAASPPTVDPVYYRDDHQPEQQTHTGLELTNKDEVVVMDEDDHQTEQQAHTGLELTDKDEVVVMDEDDHQPEKQVHTGLEQTNKDEVVVMDDDDHQHHQPEQHVHTGLEQTNKDKVVVLEDDDHQPEQQAHTGLEQTDKDEVIVIDNDQVQTTEGDEVIVTDGNHTSAQQQPPISNNCRETSSSSSDVRVKCTKDGAWLICGSDDDLDTDLVNNIPPRPENDDLCWKCKRQGGSSLLLTCSRSECATKVHKECLDGEVHFDEHDNLLCPFCCYDRMAMEYHECRKLLRCAKKRLLKFLPLLSRASKRLKDDGTSC
ncbi:RING/FYVE/PHD zinc finger superfamily protein [Raphanus sativus]|uniref:Uncharacterized protein LOC108856965 n=1 Tax=Raphanus sativus TaxID=3726 RepID=A0A6J0NNW9_RAPSA|nr:uncharacterized protein LOC108856965 [Raphanus sativus]KAJ4892733.1 RING/FYVE/PHD zinc finger superfamily protein [Raphanus sativus]